jgi:hypothetical protein
MDTVNTKHEELIILLSCWGLEAQLYSVDKKNQIDVTFCPWTHYLPTGLDHLPTATAHTNTRL